MESVMHHGMARLVAAGGGKLPESITSEIVSLAGGPEARIVVCPLASEDPESGSATAEELFRKRHGVRHVELFDFLPTANYAHQPGAKLAQLSAMRSYADSPEAMQVLDHADAFYFTGGDQRIILETLRGTAFLNLLCRRWREGKLLVAGTSAGLQIQSELALTGDFHRHEDEALPEDNEETHCTRLANHLVDVVSGFGFVRGVIFDQHFVVRRRQNRLMSAVIDHPGFLGLGVDEGTALVFVGKSGQLVRPRIVGRSCVFYFDASQASIATNATGRLSEVRDVLCGATWAGSDFPHLVRMG